MKNRNPYITILFFLLITHFGSAQVGINTNNPAVSLDVNGTVRVSDIPVEIVEDVSLSGLTGSNTLNRTSPGTNVIIQNNEIITAPVARDIGGFNLGAVPVDRWVGPNAAVDNLYLDIGTGDANEYSTFLRVYGYTQKILISGFSNGTEGRRITLFLSGSKNIDLQEEDPFSLPQNRIRTLANSGISTSGIGFIEIVYDADAGADGLGRWLVVKFRS